MGLLDLIFPKYCVNCKKYGDFLCPSCFAYISYDVNINCLVCGKPSYNCLTHPRCMKSNSIEGAFAGVKFNKISKKLVYQFKYKPNLFSLSNFIGDLLYESLIQNEEFTMVSQNKLILVPIPLHKNKFRKRGYNQAEILAREVSKRFGFPVVDYLLRTKETGSQVGLTKDERQENIKGAFEFKEKFDVKNKKIILIDDVLTSGATFSECCKVLKKSGAGRVWAIAFAKED